MHPEMLAGEGLFCSWSWQRRAGRWLTKTIKLSLVLIKPAS